MTKSKPLGHPDLKKAGLDGTWLPRGYFAEKHFECPNGHILIHNQLVRRPDVLITMKGQQKNIQAHQQLKDKITARITQKYGAGNDHIVEARMKELAVENVDAEVKYVVDPTTGTVTVLCPIDNAILMTYTPHPNFKNFDGELKNTWDSDEID